MQFVPLKTVESHEIHAGRRLRSRLVQERTALVNQVRGLLAERGIIIAQGISRLRKQLRVVVEDIENALTPLGREVKEKGCCWVTLVSNTSDFRLRVNAEEEKTWQLPFWSPARRAASVR